MAEKSNAPTAVVNASKLRPRMVCPIMTPGLMSPPTQSRLVTPGEPPPSDKQPVAFCIEHQCAFWLQMQDRAGGPISGGACAIPVLAQGVAGLQNLGIPVAQVHAQMLATAEAEARANGRLCAECKTLVPPTGIAVIRADNTMVCHSCAERLETEAKAPASKGGIEQVKPVAPPTPPAPPEVIQFRKKE